MSRYYSHKKKRVRLHQKLIYRVIGIKNICIFVLKSISVKPQQEVYN